MTTKLIPLHDPETLLTKPVFDFGSLTDDQLGQIASSHEIVSTRQFAAEELRARRIHANITKLMPVLRSAKKRIEDPRKANNAEIHMPIEECQALLALAEAGLAAWKFKL